MRGKYQVHKPLGISVPTGTKHLPFPGIYYVEVRAGGGGGSGGTPVSDFTPANGNGGKGGGIASGNRTIRDKAPVLSGGTNGVGGSPGNPGNAGGNISLSWPEGSLYAWGGAGGVGYGGAAPTGNGGRGGTAKGGWGGTGGVGGITSSKLIG